jgi:hypothetical protein
MWLVRPLFQMWLVRPLFKCGFSGHFLCLSCRIRLSRPPAWLGRPLYVVLLGNEAQSATCVDSVGQFPSFSICRYVRETRHSRPLAWTRSARSPNFSISLSITVQVLYPSAAIRICDRPAHQLDNTWQQRLVSQQISVSDRRFAVMCH